MIGYIIIGTNDLPRAKSFYDALFEVIRLKRLSAFGSHGCVWGKGWNQPCFAVAAPYDKSPATPGNGNVVGLACKDAEQVDALYAKARELGAGADDGALGGLTSGFYSKYFRDLDGNKICAFCMTRA